jgi:hypothetical protein
MQPPGQAGKSRKTAMFNFSNLTIELTIGIALILAMLAWNALT